MYLPNKYTTWYYAIITHALTRVNENRYVEKHHIIPISLGGTNDDGNLVKLTAREHFICHRLLIKMTTGINKQKMCHAAWAMATLKNPKQERIKITSKVYEHLRSNLSLTDDHKRKISEASRGIPRGPFSEEHKRNMRKPKSEEHKRALSIARSGKTYGYKHSEETKRKMSASSTGRFQGSMICEHCGKETSIGNHNRWHGMKCKHR